ncbi:MAG: glutathione S-transferase family protein [Parvibaculaceae bacterium]|nr:glutathione S-transferase family protein [Parvibaculaceae bacterium]
MIAPERFQFELVIGDKNYSSWSLRPWLAMRHAGIPFREINLRLRQETTKAEILKYSPSGFIPALLWNGDVIHDSLAICETMASLFPEKRLLPENGQARALARSYSAEMHSGFGDLRRDMPMEVLARFPGAGHTPGALANVRRIVEIWNGARSRFGATADRDEGFLFGHFTIADAMFAPVVSRLITYEADLAALGDDGTSRRYMNLIWSLPAMQDWRAGAEAEMQAQAQA